MNKFVIFLDMDGPFCSQRAMLAGMKFDPIAASIVNSALALDGVRAVVSSTVRKLCDDAADARLRLALYGLKGMTFHRQWRTGGSQDLRSDEIAEWMELNAEPDTTYIAIDDDPVNVEGVHHIKADFNGLSYQSLLLLRCHMGFTQWKEYNDWLEWFNSR